MVVKKNKETGVKIHSTNHIDSNVVSIGNLLQTNILNGKYNFVIWAAIEDDKPKIQIGIGGDLQEHGLKAEKLASVLQETVEELIKQSTTTIDVVDKD